MSDRAKSAFWQMLAIATTLLAAAVFMGEVAAGFSVEPPQSRVPGQGR